MNATPGHEIAKTLAERFHAVSVPPARYAVLVRAYAGFVRVSVGKRSWAIMPDQSIPEELVTEARRWAETHAVTTIADAVIALVPALERDLGFRWVASIPGGQHEPTETWLAPVEDSERASVGVFTSSFSVGERFVAFAKEGALEAACREVVSLVRAQLVAFERNVAASALCAGVAVELAVAFGQTSRPTGARQPSHSSSVASCVVDGEREIARVESRDGVIHVDAGLPGALGWRDALRSGVTRARADLRRAHGLVNFDERFLQRFVVPVAAHCGSHSNTLGAGALTAQWLLRDDRSRVGRRGGGCRSDHRPRAFCRCREMRTLARRAASASRVRGFERFSNTRDRRDTCRS